jgi:formiminotetrahydrofolate cyclodeaminase
LTFPFLLLSGVNQQRKKAITLIMSAVSSSAGALQIVKLYVQIKMWSVQDKNKDGHQQHRLISVSGWKCDQRFPLKVPESVSVTVSLGSLFQSLIVLG